ncbi:M14 family zinc carboxypeptidase [Sinorhizobium meliloti]|uniref:M14 family zinc carboxypeptidase n=1 Tax=Rhizobium meliloti TaxID=382 RepID=UPI003B526937
MRSRASAWAIERPPRSSWRICANARSALLFTRQCCTWIRFSQPNITQLIEMGRSIEGRPIFALRIGDRRGGVPKILFMGCHHAREWIAVEVPFLLAKELVERADEAPIARLAYERRSLGRPDGQPGRPRIQSGARAALAQESPA